MKNKWLFVLSALTLAACSAGGSNAPSKDAGVTVGGGGGEVSYDDPSPEFHCNKPIVSTAVAHAFSAGCESCAASAEDLAGDARASSAALLDFTLPAGESAALRVTAAPGMTFPAGTHPGVMARFPRGDTSDGTIVTFSIRTYLGGELQDESPIPTSIRTGGSDQDKTFFYVDATQPFDAVEFSAQTRSGVVSYTAQVFEACWDDDLAR